MTNDTTITVIMVIIGIIAVIAVLAFQIAAIGLLYYIITLFTDLVFSWKIVVLIAIVIGLIKAILR